MLGFTPSLVDIGEQVHAPDEDCALSYIDVQKILSNASSNSTDGFCESDDRINPLARMRLSSHVGRP